MMRPVHLRGEGGYTVCCGKSLNLLGQGAKLTEELDEVTCSHFVVPPLDDGVTALRQAVDENVRILSGVTTVHNHGPEEDCAGRGCFGAELKLREGDQQLPVPNDEPDVQSQVIADIEERRKVGISRYGTALQPFNGRDALRDAYEEALDLAMYLKQAMLERDCTCSDTFNPQCPIHGGNEHRP